MYAFYKKYEYVILSLFVVIPYLYASPFWDGGYRDTDCYIHAWRVYDLMQTQRWAEEILMKSNYPFGEVIHYTRIMDVMWLLIALPLTFFYPLKEAVFNGVNNLRYIDKIIREWSKKGIKTEEDVINDRKKFQTKKSNKELFDYDWLNE